MFTTRSAVAVLLLSAAASLVPAAEPKIRVGTFDSRGVAVAYAASPQFRQRLTAKLDQHKQAKGAGDLETAKQLEADGRAAQQQLHAQGFSTASVREILLAIQDQLPAIAREARVALIASKWEIFAQDPAVELVDVTELVVRPFQPSPRTLKIIQDLGKHTPIPEEQARTIKD